MNGVDHLDVTAMWPVASEAAPTAPPPFSLAAARALFRAPQDATACWADQELPDGTIRVCGHPEATSLGLCADHLEELFGLHA